MARRTVAINGVDIVCEDGGDGARPFVLVHGFTGTREDFRDHLPALAALGRTVVYDQRGHGESTNTGDAETYTFDQLVSDLRAFLDALGIARCDLLGHSMGGMIALRFALRHPERVASLVLMDTAARPPDGILRAPLAAGGRIACDQGMETLSDLLRARAADDPARPAASRRLEVEMGAEAYWARHRRRLTSMDPEAFAALGAMLADQEPLTDRVAEIACPTLVMVGDQDLPFLRPAAEMAGAIPAATQVTIADAAHSPQIENPSAWIAAIRAHLVRVREGAASISR